MVEPKTARPGGGRAEALSTLTRTTCSAERSWRARYSAAQERRSSRAYSAAKARVRVEHMRRQRADAAVPKNRDKYSNPGVHTSVVWVMVFFPVEEKCPLQLAACTRREPALRPYRRAPRLCSDRLRIQGQTYRGTTSCRRYGH